MLSYLLDTNICIRAMKSKPPGLLVRFNAAAGRMAVSVVTQAELLYGAERSPRRDANLSVISRFLQNLDVLPLDEDAARHYASIRAGLERVGLVIGPNDLLLAAHARSLGLSMVTSNRREFDRVPGLSVEDWNAD